MPDRGTISASRRAQAGFSLLEMLIAVGILSAAAYVALDTVESDRGQMRFDLTETRLKMIRRAIVGDPDLAVNGGPVVSGFAADVGALPRCLDALITQDPDCNGDGTDDSADIPPVPSPPDYGATGQPDGLAYGWRGPYLTAGPDGVSDAWGNTGGPNFGWDVTPSLPDSFEVSSLARDRDSGAVVADSFDEDQAMVPIGPANFRVPLTPSAISVEVTATAAINLCIALLAPDPADPADWLLIPADVDGDGTTDGARTIASGDTDTLAFSAPQEVAHGPRPLLIYDADDTTYVDPIDCSPALTKEDLVTNAVLRRFNILLAARTPPAATFRITLP